MTTQMPVIVEEFGLKDSNDLLVSGPLFDVKTNLVLPVLNYQYGYIRELNETLIQYTSNDAFLPLKFPLVWLEQPFTVVRNEAPGYFGRIERLRFFICQQTDVNYKARQRMDLIFKPILYPIYWELLNGIDLSLAFLTQSRYQIQHSFTDRYYWGEEQQDNLADKIDCMVCTFNNLIVAHKQICIPFKSF